MKQLTIIGNVGFDAVVKEINGSKFLEFSVAVNERFKKQDGTTVESTDWINCAYRNIGLAPYIRKGDKILVQGNMKVNVYKDRNNNMRAGIQINATNVQLLGGSKREDGNSAATSSTADNDQPLPMIPGEAPVDDLPF